MCPNCFQMYLNFPIPESNINFKNDIKFEVRFLIAMAIFQVLDSHLSKWLLH